MDLKKNPHLKAEKGCSGSGAVNMNSVAVNQSASQHREKRNKKGGFLKQEIDKKKKRQDANAGIPKK